MTDRARELDRIAAEAFPAIDHVDLDGWVLRSSGLAPWGRTRSVWTPRAGSMPMAARLAAVRTFYEDGPYPPLVMVSDHSEPPGLAESLTADGWAAWDGAQVQAVSPVPELDGRRWHRVPTERVATEAWSAATARLQCWDAATTEASDDLLARTPGTVVGIAATERGEVVGVGRGVLHDGWLGIFGMITAAAHRGRGVGAAVLARLLLEGRQLGAEGAYLQVERANHPALALYASAGFTRAYDYDYWAPADAASRDSYC